MITQLRNEEKDYIDRILTDGMYEIKDIPSFELSANKANPNQNNNDYFSYTNSSIHNNLKNNNNIYQLNFDYNLTNIDLDNSNLYISKNMQKIKF